MNLEGFYEGSDGKLGPDEAWEEEWVGMPEFKQKAKEAYRMINVRFNTEEEVQDFAKLLGQNITPKTKAIWHPQLVRDVRINTFYTDES